MIVVIKLKLETMMTAVISKVAANKINSPIIIVLCLILTNYSTSPVKNVLCEANIG